MTDSVEHLNQECFNGRLHPAAIGLMRELANQRPEVRQFVTRACRLMKARRLRAEDFTLLYAWELGSLVSRVLPGAWGGMIPPMTFEGRHARLDDYLESGPYWRKTAGARLVDLGCGFPPRTTLETALRFGDVEVIGADPAFDRFLVHDAQGDYACFDDSGNARYFQPGVVDIARWDSLLADPEATRARFRSLFDRLRPGLAGARVDELASFEHEGARIVQNPVLEFAASNLRYVSSGIGTLDVHDVDVIRCMNVLVYFDKVFRKEALEWATRVLKPGGILVSGMNWARCLQARYFIHQREGGRLVTKEFSFSIDNLRPIEYNSFFCLYDDDPEMEWLTRLVGLIRSDDDYRVEFDRRLDELYAEHRLAARDSEGYLQMSKGLGPGAIESGVTAISSVLVDEGYVDRAVEVLERAGFKAWRNCVDHVSVAPASVGAP